VFSNRTLLAIASTLLGLSLDATNARAQAAPPQFYIVCSSQENLPNVYMSGTLQGPAAALQTFSAGFTQFLKQTYSYQGGVSCIPMRTIVNVQTFMQSRTTALHNMKKNLVQTGWTEAAPSAAVGAPGNTANVLGNLLSGGKSNTTPAASSPAKTPAAQQPQGAGQQTAAGSGQSGSSAPGAPVIQIFNNLFGAGSSGGSGGSGNPSASTGTSGSASKGSPGGPAGAGKSSAASGSGTSTSSEVTSVLSNLFAKGSGGGASSDGESSSDPGKSASKGGPGKGAPAQPAAAPQAPAVNALPPGALGMAQYQNTKLTVYGCGRQGTQVLCVTDLTNQNSQETLLKSDAAWKDAFLVDDRGDRHTRTDGYFLNVDGDRRQQLDLDYGKSAHFILAFDAVQTKVEKVTLRSATGGLNVQDIGLIAPGDAQSGANQARGATTP
jgi:hypothetical protein